MEGASLAVKELTTRCVDLYKRHDMSLIASQLGIGLLEVSYILRKARIVTDVQPHELSYIVEHIETMPIRAIEDHLGLSATQLEQILRRFKIRKHLQAERPTLESCIAKTRWLIETRLQLAIDDQLPRLITNEHFTDNGLYSAVKFATAAKEKCPTAKHFSACAFLVSQTYPGRFQPWQFRHAKSNRYFTGRGGSRNFLTALMWLIETKLGITSDALPYVMRSYNFLSTRTLQDYGLGPHWWREHWSTKAEMLEALARHAGIAPAPQVDRETMRGRLQLRGAGINPDCCAVPGCITAPGDNIQVHHIVQRATRIIGDFDLHAAENLVPLCRHHHVAADRMRPTIKLLRSPEMLRPWLIEKLRTPASSLLPLSDETQLNL